MNILIVGGTSGVGLELAKRWVAENHRVLVTGRKRPEGLASDILFRPLSIGPNIFESRHDIVEALKVLPPIDIFVYAAGFWQQGHISDLSDDDILTMSNVGAVACAFFLKRILAEQGELVGFISITSTSATNARVMEPMYSTMKAGLKMFTEAVALDPKIRKTLEVAPAGIDSPFWRNVEKDTKGFLSTEWVAEQTLSEWEGKYKYKSVLLLRDPARVQQVGDIKFE